jgi:hypothetical protein
MLPDRYGTVLTLKRLSIASPQLPYPYKAGRIPGSLYELVKALRNAPVGSWLSVNLAALPGSTLAAKQSSTARAARRLFYPIQTQIKGSRLFVRRAPIPVSCPAPPNDFKRRPVFSEPLSGFGGHIPHRLSARRELGVNRSKSRATWRKRLSPGEAGFGHPALGSRTKPRSATGVTTCTRMLCCARLRPQPAWCCVA